jgi:hypothetical protein
MDPTIVAALITAFAGIVAAFIGLLRRRSKDAKDSSSADGPGVFEEKANQSEKHAIPKEEIPLDVTAFERLQKIINSDWIQNFEINQLTSPQYVYKATKSALRDYIYESEKPENEFINEKVADAHNEFVVSIHQFLVNTARVTVPVDGNSEISVIITKAEGQKRWIKEYAQKYDDEVKIITDSTEAIIELQNLRTCIQARGNF